MLFPLMTGTISTHVLHSPVAQNTADAVSADDWHHLHFAIRLHDLLPAELGVYSMRFTDMADAG